MKVYLDSYVRKLSIPLITLGLSACGSSSNITSVSTSDVSLRFSDAPVEGVSSVTIKVDKLIFNRSGEDIVVDRFTSDELGIDDEDTFTLDLLDVQGNDNRLVMDAVALPVGEYQNLRIEILDEDINNSYVDDMAGRQELKVPSDQLKLGSFTVSSERSQTFVVEFGLRQALTYNPGPQRYILKPRGVRVVRLEDASTISGTVDLNAIHLDAACSDKPDSSVSNVAYLYEGHGLDPSTLGDVFIREEEGMSAGEFDPDVGAEVIAPVAATLIDGGTGNYLFSYLLPGDYTLAMSCKSVSDDPIIHEGISIPLPASELYELSLPSETDLDCDFPKVGACIAL